MWRTHQVLLAYYLLNLTHLATSRDMAAITAHLDSRTPTPALNKRSSSGLAFVSNSAVPTGPDGAPSGKGNDSNNNSSGGLVNYYFGFLALIVCAVGLCIFIVLRRRHRVLRYRAGLQVGAQPGVDGGRHDGGWSNWNPERREQWHARWRSSADVSREEGLNEYGEAPPVYVPKTSSEERERAGDGSGPAVPLQTLSRDDAGLKPPEYSEVRRPGSTVERRASTASASSSRVPEPRGTS